jgi:hypothetical protein
VLLVAPVLAQNVQPDPSQQAGTSPVGKAQTNDVTQGAPQQGGGEPVGTAAAPYEKTVGVAASRPAGVVIAPAKQRRAHSLLIKVGLIAAGAVAIGTIVALSKSSPSRPN